MIRFRRLEFGDLPAIYRWITGDPVVNHFWAEDRRESYEEVTEGFRAYITGAKPTEPYLILDGERPIGYIQTYLWRDWPGYETYVDLTGAASLDLFIGESSYRGRGLGPDLLTRFLRTFVFVKPEVTACVITPEVSNTHAIRAYEKVGFRHVRTVSDIPDEPGPVYFMRIEREQALGEGG